MKACICWLRAPTVVEKALCSESWAASGPSTAECFTSHHPSTCFTYLKGTDCTLWPKKYPLKVSTSLVKRKVYALECVVSRARFYVWGLSYQIICQMKQCSWITKLLMHFQVAIKLTFAIPTFLVTCSSWSVLNVSSKIEVKLFKIWFSELFASSFIFVF